MHDFYCVYYPNRRKEVEELIKNIEITSVSGENIKDIAPYVEFVIKTNEEITTNLINQLIYATKDGKIEKFQLFDRMDGLRREWFMEKSMQIPEFREFKVV